MKTQSLNRLELPVDAARTIDTITFCPARTDYAVLLYGIT